MNILLLSAYDAASHHYWHQLLVNKLSDHQWEVFTLPDRYFNWRVRGNSLTWGFGDELKDVSRFDCVIATSMVDLSSLRGMSPALAQLPTILYFHENQFAYPNSDNQHKSVEPQIVSLYSAICADILVFNSHYNLNTFLGGVKSLLACLPDCVPSGIVEHLKGKSRCLPVPISNASDPDSMVFEHPVDVVQIIWNHRWEYDKGPELLFGCLESLPVNLSVVFHIVGQKFRSSPCVFGKIEVLLKERGWLGEWGFITEKNDYVNLLKQSHVVLSTAIHDFQGLSVLEAVAENCIPVVPDDLVYPEWFDEAFRYSRKDNEVRNLCAHIIRLIDELKVGAPLKAPSVKSFMWEQKEQEYRMLLEDVLNVKQP